MLLWGTPAFLAGLGHFIIDLYSSFYPLSYPVLADRLGLSVAQVGLLATAYSVSSALPLPLVGYLTDRLRYWPGTSVPVLAGAVWLILLGSAASFQQAILLVALAGLASAALHPFAAAMAAQVEARRRTTALSLFVFAGNLGVTVGPLLGGVLVGYLGRPVMLALLGPAGLAAAWLWRGEAWARRAAEAQPKFASIVPRRIFLRRFAPLGVLVGVRGAVFFAINAYLPLFLTQRGWTLQGAGTFQAALLAGVAIGGVSVSWLTRRISRRSTVLGSTLLVAPALMLLVTAQTPLWPAQAFLAGWLFGLANPLTVGLAQEMNPGAVGSATGMIMTAGFVGIVSGVQVVGWTGQALGLGTVLAFWPALLIVGVVAGATGYPSAPSTPSTPSTATSSGMQPSPRKK